MKFQFRIKPTSSIERCEKKYLVNKTIEMHFTPIRISRKVKLILFRVNNYMHSLIDI